MPLYHIFVLSVIQGITEFLPISSSGHLILLPLVTGWPDQGLQMDVAVHVGTLIAVVIYFWKDCLKMLKGLWSLVRGKVDGGGRLFLQLSLATIPAVLAGLWLSNYGVEHVRSMRLIGWTSIIFGVLLYLVDRLRPMTEGIGQMTYAKAFFVGLGQAIALIPGTSRSGITMTFGRFLGLKRPDAAQFAFLLAIPAILAAATHTGFKMITSHSVTHWTPFLWAMGFSALAGLAAIRFMMSWLRSSDFTPFVLYRLALGALLLGWSFYGETLRTGVSMLLHKIG